MESILRYVVNRLKEGSTWRGLAMVLTAVGVTLQPDQLAAIISVGTAVAGAIGVFWPDKVVATADANKAQ